MAQPVLIRAYSTRPAPPGRRQTGSSERQQLPPVSSYAFANILIAADSADFQQAIDGIAEICAKHKLSLADEYSMHLPPVGEIGASGPSANNTTAAIPVISPAPSLSSRRQLFRSGGNRKKVLASVPEASSGSSEESRRSRSSGIFGFRVHQVSHNDVPVRRLRIGRMGRTVPAGGTTALAIEVGSNIAPYHAARNEEIAPLYPTDQTIQRSEAQASLQRILSLNAQPG